MEVAERLPGNGGLGFSRSSATSAATMAAGMSRLTLNCCARCDPVLRLTVAGEGLPAEVCDLAGHPVEAVWGTV